jgi:hypothetical protein
VAVKLSRHAVVALLLIVACGIGPVAVNRLGGQAQPALVIEGGTLIDGNGGVPVQDAVGIEL